jgi:CheY-like chemotaxis protein
MKQLNCILLVDDNYATNLLHKKILEKLGIALIIKMVENGEAAIDYMAHIEESKDGDYPNPDLIFLDINMPRMNGWEFLEEYRQRGFTAHHRIILIMLTTSPNPEDEKKALSYHEISGYIKKPLTAAAINEVMEKYFS